MSRAVKVMVVGGGISGLATAYLVERKSQAAGLDVDVTVLEADDLVGGKIKSSLVEGYLCEQGAQGFIDNKPEPISLVRSVGLGDRLLVSSDQARKRYVLHRGSLERVPESPPAALATRLLSWSGKIRAARELWTKPASPGKDETVAEFAQRHLGPEAVANLIDPMVAGIFAGRAEKVSISSAFPVMTELEAEGGGSLIRGMIRRQRKKRRSTGGPGDGAPEMSKKLTSFLSGMEEAPARLAESIRGQIVTGAVVSGVDRGTDGYTAFLDEGEKVRADALVLAVPAESAAEILEEFDGRLAETAAGIRYVPVNVVVLGFDREHIGRELDGFGFVVPSKEHRRILGALWTSSIFPDHTPEGKVSLRVMLGGDRNPEDCRLSDEQTFDLVAEELRATMGIEAEPVFRNLTRHPVAIPQYYVGHSGILEEIEDRLALHPGLFMTGNAYRGVGFNDCIINAGRMADSVVNYVEQAG